MAGTVATAASTEVALPARRAIAQQIAAFGEVLLLGGWLGSMMFFSFAVAPSAFAVLPTRELAGVMVTSAIGKIETIGLVIGALLVVMQIAKWRGNHLGAAMKTVKALLLLTMIGSAGLSRFWISPSMVSLRAQMGGRIDDLAATDPLRIQFNDLHQYSVGLMSVAMLSGLVVLFLTVRSWINR